ncbi:endonuclease/exonuclease/phosphatase family protein [Halodurantibacterium flavum]|uniref:Endonuclease/exonuclease/phosphatase family protein n=1 Tax=Halodurantibacterium flavum TaxID=1382802 RepID=A0ABW4S2V0_9RHOB
MRHFLLLWLFLLVAAPLRAEDLRVAVYNAALARKGPGLLLQDILARDAQVEATVGVIASAAPDVLLLLKIDFDHGGAALDALAALLDEAGLSYPHRFSKRPNSGWASGLDLDGNGRLGTPDDALGFGRFAGSGGMAILSRYPLEEGRDFSSFLWRDLPGALLPEAEGKPILPEPVLSLQPLASVAAWEVPVETPQGTVRMLGSYATPPVFGGPNQRNLRRNHDEVAFWSALLDGALPLDPPQAPFVLLSGTNLDPDRGDGMGQAMRDLLNRPDLHDPLPGTDSVRWDRTGPMRVDYALPSLPPRAAGIVWPLDVLPPELAAVASVHALIWVDLDLADLAPP